MGWISRSVVAAYTVLMTLIFVGVFTGHHLKGTPWLMFISLAALLRLIFLCVIPVSQRQKEA